ncbi:hypothetical protein C8R44DRAFT_688579 [Mycena epipterygia]|nr:hypothetical protein C8R44DRAFT_688579 [Mycena epipterygia]
MNDDDIRVDDLWFSNDTLVIRAEKKVFRVTKSILTARSSVLRDMVAFPQPTSDQTNVIDGSPVVVLHDSAADVEVFLRAIFDSSYFMPPPTPVQLDVVLGILRLAHKYDVDYLHRRALQHLSVQYGPTSLEAYRAPDNPDHIIYTDPKALAHLKIIGAVTAVGAFWLLPVAYYLASRSNRKELRVAISLGIEEHHVQTCIAGQSDLVRGTVKAWGFLLNISTVHCVRKESCDGTRSEELADLYTSIYQESDLSPLDDWPEESWMTISESQGLCGDCVTRGKETHAEALQGFWNQLPAIFDLPPWSELEAMRNAATQDVT